MQGSDQPCPAALGRIMIKKYLPTLDALEPHELAALQQSYERLKKRFKARNAVEEQRIAETLMDALKAGESLEQAERTVRRVMERI